MEVPSSGNCGLASLDSTARKNNPPIRNTMKVSKSVQHRYVIAWWSQNQVDGDGHRGESPGGKRPLCPEVVEDVVDIHDPPDGLGLDRMHIS